MNRLHPQDLRAIMAAALQAGFVARHHDGEASRRSAIWETDAILAELERTAKPEPANERPAATPSSDFEVHPIGTSERLASLTARVEELEVGIAAIGDMAVCDWDESTVLKADALVPNGRKYSDRLREMFTASCELERERANSEMLADALERIGCQTDHGNADPCPICQIVDKALTKHRERK